jgi:hypothetical protein
MLNRFSDRTTITAIVFFFFILIFFLTSSVWSETHPSWIKLAPNLDKIPQVNVVKSDFTQIGFEIQVPGVWAEEISTKGGFYSQLTIPSAGVSAVVSQPNLPVITKMVQIPFGAQVSLQVESYEVAERSLAEMKLTRPLVPVQLPIPKIAGVEQQVPFSIDQKYYQKNSFLPAGLAEIGGTGIIRGHRFATILIHPVSYNPQLGRVKIYSKIKVKLTLFGSDVSLTQNQLERYASPPFENLCSQLFINYPSYSPMIKTSPELPLGYLIITPEDFYPGLTNLVKWKAQKGFQVTVAQVPEIGSTNNEIKSYIQNAYDTWTIPPTYVLLVGDVEYLPAWTGTYSSTATDLYYVKMDPDDFADIFRGRLPAKSLTEVEEMVNKILYYENPSSSDRDWMKKVSFVAASDMNGFAEITHDYVISNYCDSLGMICDTIWERLGGSTAMITNSVDDGRSILCYSGHGYETGWSSVPFNQSNVANLANADKYPFVLSHACLTGKFNVSESYGETWAKSTGKAGIAFWGASNYTYWDEDDILEKRMFQAALTETSYSIGSMTDKALWGLYQYYGGEGYSRYYLDVYNIMGDPSLDLWTMTAEPLQAAFLHFIKTGTSTVALTVNNPDSLPVSGALVCLSKGDEVFETGYTGPSGQLTLYPSPLTSGAMNVTVTAHNFLPVLDSILVSSDKGDVTGDGVINLGDLVFVINYLYKNGPAPNPMTRSDVNCDGKTDLGDLVYLINYLYKNGPAPCS